MGERWGFEGWGFEGWGARKVGGPTEKKWGREGWGPEGWGAEGWGAQNFALFSPVPPQNSFFSSLSGGLSRGILVVFEVAGRSNVHVWSSRAVVCEPRRPSLVGPPGFHTTVREPKRAHLRVPVFKNTTKIQREDTQRGKKRTNFAAGEGKKKERNFGRSRGRGPREGGPGKGGPGKAVPGRAVKGRAVPGRAVPEGRSREGRSQGHRT